MNLWKSLSAKANHFFPPPTYQTTDKISHPCLPTIILRCTTFVENENFFFSKKQYTTTKKPKTFLLILKFAIYSILRQELDPTSDFGHTVKRTVSFDNILHVIDEKNKVTFVDFDCGITFCTAAPTEVGHINRERNNLPRSCEKPMCIPNKDLRNCTNTLVESVLYPITSLRYTLTQYIVELCPAIKHY